MAAQSSKKTASRKLPDSFDVYVFVDKESNEVLGSTKKKDLVLDFIEANPNARHVKTKLFNKLPS